MNETACRENERSKRTAEIYIPTNVCVNVTDEAQFASGWPPLGPRKFSCDSKNLMAEACDSIEYSSYVGAYLMAPNNEDENPVFGWGLCMNLTNDLGKSSQTMHCVDGQVHTYNYDDDKCSLEKQSWESQSLVPQISCF